MTVPVPPADTVSEVTEEAIVGPANAGTTETVYVILELVTEVAVMVKLRVIPDEGISPKLKLG